ncbi:uncharacterized protein [Amphiura filiformis]|uniref:uncharacterized protein n=1 Tax=Amphiura filiformis TaxID=82378 RepID=UPI003B223EAB
MGVLKRKNRTSSFSITKPPDVRHEGLLRSRRSGGIRRTLLDVLRSLCCMVRQDEDQQPGREPCMYECNTEDSYWKVSGSGTQSQHVQEPIEDISSCLSATCKDDPVPPSGRSEKIIELVTEPAAESIDTPSAPLQLPKQVAIYRDSDLEPISTGNKFVLGHGSSSIATLNKLRSCHDPVAVKRLNPTEPRSILIKEAEILRKLDHCIAFPELIGFIDHNTSPAIILEFVGDKSTLTSISIFDALSTLTPRLLTSEWLAIASDVASGLAKLHSAGFTHGDLHNNNVLLCRSPPQLPNSKGRKWQAKIIDLGSAEPLDSPTAPLQLSDQDKAVYRESLPFKAPELIEGITGQTEATDTYAFGYLMYDVGYFCKIDILRALVKGCMDKDPSQRKQVSVVATELSFFAKRYQQKENDEKPCGGGPFGYQYLGWVDAWEARTGRSWRRSCQT